MATDYLLFDPVVEAREVESGSHSLLSGLHSHVARRWMCMHPVEGLVQQTTGQYQSLSQSCFGLILQQAPEQHTLFDVEQLVVSHHRLYLKRLQFQLALVWFSSFSNPVHHPSHVWVISLCLTYLLI